MLLNDNIIRQFSHWHIYFQKFIESESFDNIFRQLKVSKQSGANIAPLPADVFKCFEKTDTNKLKCIICGLAPYNTFIDKVPVANGLAFSSKQFLQPSLQQMYGCWEDLAKGRFDIDMIQDPNLDYLAEQGVLLYNTSLTTTEGVPDAHKAIWSQFNEYFWTKVINEYFRGLPILFLGEVAKNTAKYLRPGLHHSIFATHPASAAYQRIQWATDAFKQIDEILKEQNKIPIKWYKRTGDTPILIETDDIPF